MPRRCSPCAMTTTSACGGYFEASVGALDPAVTPLTPAQRRKFTSDPYVLVQYFDHQVNDWRMAVYFIAHENEIYSFHYPQVTTTKPIRAPYPVDTVSGFGVNDTDQTDNSKATGLINGTYFLTASDAAMKGRQAVWWLDPTGNAWAISGPVRGRKADGTLDRTLTTPHLYAGFFYNLRADFWHPDFDATTQDPFAKQPGSTRRLPGWKTSNSDPVALLIPTGVKRPECLPAPVRYDTIWPENIPLLRIGETLTVAGGEYKADHPTQIEGGEVVNTPGLPGVVGWAAGQVVFDSINPAMSATLITNYSVRLVNPLQSIDVRLPMASVLQETNVFQPSRTDFVQVRNGLWSFPKLSASLQRRISYDPILQN